MVFRELPYGEDELGLTVTEPMGAVYFHIEPANCTFMAVIGNPSELPASSLLLYFTEAKRFPYWLLSGKVLVVE